MGGHGHHHEPYVVPKAEIYNNQVEKINELNYLQKELAKRGLKDPWIRYEISRLPHINGLLFNHIQLRSNFYIWKKNTKPCD